MRNLTIRFIALLLMAATAGAAYALDITASGGNLAKLVGADASTASSLTVKGSVNAADLFFIADKMPSLRTLDLSEAAIEAYDGVAVFGHTTYAADALPAGVFAGSKIESVTLPSCAVGDAAFTSSALRELTLGASELGLGAFADCQDLAAVTIAAPVSLPQKAFSGCSALATINGSEQILAIGNAAFEGCKNLTDFNFGSKLTAIGDAAFRNSGIKNVDLSGADHLTAVGAWAFASCPDLESVAMPQTNAEIEQGVFFGCTALTTVDGLMPGDVLPAYVYANDSALTGGENLLSPAMTELGEYSLKGASSVNELVLPPNLEAIGSRAMEGMTGLKSIDAANLTTIPDIGEGVWQGVDQSMVHLYVFDEMFDAFSAAEQWQEFNIQVTSAGPSLVVDTDDLLRCRFVGDVLVATLSRPDVEAVYLYDLAGRLLAQVQGAGATEVTLDTAAWPQAVYVVAAQTPDSRICAMKVAK